MGEISDDTRFGIITHIDDRYNYVWNDKLGPWELRFPINKACKFELGEIVRYVQSFDARSLQVQHNLMQVRPEIRKHELIRTEKLKWRIKIPVTFAPVNSDLYRQMQMMTNDDEPRVKVVAYSHDFKLVVTFVEGLDFEVSRVYMAWVTRIPRIHDPIAKKIGTIFCMVGKCSMELEMDHQIINETIENCPWKHLLQNSPEDELGLPQNKRTNAVTAMQSDMMSDNVHEIYEEEPMEDNYVESLQKAVEGEEHLGVIVLSEPEYSVIWSPDFQLIRMQLLNEQDPDHQPDP